MAHALSRALAAPKDERFWFGVAICVPLLIIFFAWLFLVTKGAVAEASMAYAQRLLANCEPVTTAPRPRRTSSDASKSAPVPGKPPKRKEAPES